MKSLLLGAGASLGTFLRRVSAIFATKVLGALSSRPALMRALLVTALFGAVAVPVAALLGAGFGAVWALWLAALFLGMGAERDSTEWNVVFALPALRHFQFWRWQALERKRYQAVLFALAVGQLFVWLLPILWGLV